MAENKTVTFEGLEELVKLIGSAANLSDPIYKPIWEAFNNAGKLLEAQIKQNLIENNSIGASGQLRASISSSKVQISKDAIYVEVGAGKLPYAPYVEFGAGPVVGEQPFRPSYKLAEPGEPIYEWVRKKQISGVAASRKKEDRLAHINTTTFVARKIISSIRKKGIKPHPYFFKALDQKREEINQLFEKAVDELVKQFVK